MILLCGPAAAGCGSSTESTPAVCDTESPDGAWSPVEEDWQDPGAPDNECLTDDVVDDTGDVLVDCVDENHCDQINADVPDNISAHHCYTTAVHAIHMFTGELLLYHGEQDERVWRIGSDPEDITWHPVPHETLTWESNSTAWVPDLRQPDLFCTGHVQLGNEILTAGGNVNGTPAMGGLRETYRFSPFLASNPMAINPECAYGWQLGEDVSEDWTNPSPRMAYDRWYPTLTVLGDGRVLISGGSTQLLDHAPETFKPAADGYGPGELLTPYLEIYDPTVSPTRIDVLENAPFPAGDGVPEYPFMFLLHNGDVAYVGALAANEIAATGQQHGRILIADYNHPNYDDEPDPDLWAWADVTIESQIRGGSAVMTRPSQIMKSGGLNFGLNNQVATNLVETVDLTDWPISAPETFDGSQDPEAPSNMHRSRHFHTMTLLPDGRVLATGGNRFGNGNTGDHWNNPCEYPENVPIASIACEDGCPSLCVDTANQYPQTGNVCGDVAPRLRCSLFHELRCNCAGITAEEPCEENPLCEWNGSCDNAFECEDVGEDFLGSECGENGFCDLPCYVEGSFCGDIMPLGGQCLFESQGMCAPQNNACYAEYSAEIYDPDCQTWTELGEQQHPRMYHSTALLLPDARVISMGGGHRQGLEEQVFAEYFEPEYASGAAVGPEFGFGMPEDYADAFADGTPVPPNYLSWGGRLNLVVNNEVDPGYAMLVRLGSVTHGFDMDQRSIRMAVSEDDDDTQYFVQGEGDPGLWPITPEIVPPGYYMLFLLTASGEPGNSHYVKVGDAESIAYVCEVSEEFEASEGSCNAEPITGTCPQAGIVSTAVTAPTVDGPSGPVEGFSVLAPAALVDDPAEPTTGELTALTALCTHACEAHFGDQTSQSANCDTPGALQPPVVVAASQMPLDLVAEAHRHGEDLFSGQVLTCDLGRTCHDAFDETLRLAAPSRVTPAAAASGVGQEFRMNVAGSMGVDSTAAEHPVDGSLVGTVGFSHCTAGNASDPCPFYLGELELELTEPINVSLSCDGGPETHQLESMTIRLAQPAFGIAQESTAWKAFPPGSLILEGEAVVDEIPLSWRRPNEEPVYAFVNNGWIQVQGIGGSWIEFTVPCGSGEAAVLAWWGFETDSPIGTPPSITINVASSVQCPSTVTLAHSKSDSQNDIVSTRWLVDGVLMAPGTTSVPFTTAHELTAIVRDSRGATRTKTKTVTCQ